MIDCFECHCLRERILKLEQQMARTMGQQYEWAGIINKLACLYIDGALSTNELDYANDMIELVNPYLGYGD